MIFWLNVVISVAKLVKIHSNIKLVLHLCKIAYDY